MNTEQQRSHGQAVQRVHKRIDTLAECVDLEVAEKMTEIRTLVTRVNDQTRIHSELAIEDIRLEYGRQIDALSKRIVALEQMTIRQLLHWMITRAW